MAKPFFSIIVPVRNAAATLPFMLIDIDRVFAGQQQPYEFIVVDDGSTDMTTTIVERFMPAVKNLKLFTNSGSRGEGSAVKVGMLAAKGSWRIAVGADITISACDVARLSACIESGRRCDAISLCQSFGETFRHAPHLFPLLTAEAAANIFTKLLLGGGVQKSWCESCCFSANTAEYVFERIRCASSAYSAEALVLADRLGYKVASVYGKFANPQLIRSRLRRYLQILAGVIKIRWWLWRNIYQL